MYPDTQPECFPHARVDTRVLPECAQVLVPNLIVLLILGWVLGYSLESQVPNLKPDCFAHTRVGTRYSQSVPRYQTLNLIVLLILGWVPG